MINIDIYLGGRRARRAPKGDHVEVVRLDVNAIDHDGKPVTDLKTSRQLGGHAVGETKLGPFLEREVKDGDWVTIVASEERQGVHRTVDERLGLHRDLASVARLLKQREPP